MNRAIKHIHFIVRNTFLKREAIEFSMPYNPIHAMYGKYSAFAKAIRKTAAETERVHLSFISVRHFFKTSVSNRMVIKLANGFELDMPNDLNKFDCLIIQKQLEVLRMPMLNERERNKLLNSV